MKNLPNILSVLRIVLLPFLAWQVLVDNFLVAGILLVASGLTDALDGFLARRFGWVSDVGKVLDPAADKLTQVTVCVLLMIKLRHLWIFFVLLLLKELVMLVLGGWLLRRGVRLEGARWFGKLVTILFYLVMIAILLFPGIPGKVTVPLLTVLCASAWAAGAMYVPEFIAYKKKATTPGQHQDGGEADS